MHWLKGGWGNTVTHGSGRGMKSQDNYPLIRTLSLRGGETDDGKPIPSQGLSKQRVQGQKIATKSGMTGLVHQHPMGGTAPGGGGGTLHCQAEEALQMIKGMMNQKKRMKRMILMKRLCQ